MGCCGITSGECTQLAWKGCSTGGLFLRSGHLGGIRPNLDFLSACQVYWATPYYDHHSTCFEDHPSVEVPARPNRGRAEDEPRTIISCRSPDGGKWQQTAVEAIENGHSGVELITDRHAGYHRNYHVRSLFTRPRGEECLCETTEKPVTEWMVPRLTAAERRGCFNIMQQTTPLLHSVPTTTTTTRRAAKLALSIWAYNEGRYPMRPSSESECGRGQKEVAHHHQQMVTKEKPIKPNLLVQVVWVPSAGPQTLALLSQQILLVVGQLRNPLLQYSASGAKQIQANKRCSTARSVKSQPHLPTLEKAHMMLPSS